MIITKERMGFRAKQTVWGGFIHAWGLTRMSSITKLLKQIYANR